ncbi:MAG TPA: hypothetical protein VMW38_18700 [Terriglobia bacterium]|nr:hypothetical protein [Terriglobia bacterium]
MTEDIHKVDRPVFDQIRIQPNQENQGNPQKRRGKPPKNQSFNGLPEGQATERASLEPDDSASRLLDIQV